jgi:hypothetical protein
VVLKEEIYQTEHTEEALKENMQHEVFRTSTEQLECLS